MKINDSNLVSILDRASAELRRGEKVKISFSSSARRKYIEIQREGRYHGLIRFERFGQEYLEKVA